MILRKEPNSSVDGYTKTMTILESSCSVEGCIQIFLTSVLGERNAVDIIHSFGIDMFPKFSKNTKHKERTSPVSVSCFHVLQVSFVPNVENFFMLCPLCSLS